jgi:hypothetical protein
MEEIMEDPTISLSLPSHFNYYYPPQTSTHSFHTLTSLPAIPHPSPQSCPLTLTTATTKTSLMPLLLY